MAKRFTDTTKWEDEWYYNLSNDDKVIWQYLLDTCDNAGIWKRNISKLNYICKVNTTAEQILSTFEGRITVIGTEKWFINKFCIFQYGNDFLKSKNKAVVSAVVKLLEAEILKDNGNSNYSILLPYNNPINSVSIGYQYSIDTPKEQEQVKDIVQEEVIIKDISKEQVKRLIQDLVEAEDAIKIQMILDDCNEITWNKIYQVLEYNETQKVKIRNLVELKLGLLN